MAVDDDLVLLGALSVVLAAPFPFPLFRLGIRDLDLGILGLRAFVEVQGEAQGRPRLKLGTEYRSLLAKISPQEKTRSKHRKQPEKGFCQAKKSKEKVESH